MTLYHLIIQTRAGASPLPAFDGNASGTFNDKAKRLVAMLTSQSLSVTTTDEGSGMVVRLQSNNFTGSRYFVAGWYSMGDSSSNASEKAAGIDKLALDLQVTPLSSITVDLSSWGSAVQTGTYDCTFDFIYDDGNTPEEEIKDLWSHCRNRPAKGGTICYIANQATTTRTEYTGTAGQLFNLPAEATTVIGAVNTIVTDTAVTASQEVTGYSEIEGLGVTDQKVVVNGGIPDLGTPVEFGSPCRYDVTPMYVTKESRNELSLRAFINLYSAKTGGVAAILNLLWI